MLFFCICVVECEKGSNQQKIFFFKLQKNMRMGQHDNISPRGCVVDELHLFLRITDVLFDNLFVELCRLDYVSTLYSTQEWNR